MIVGFGVVAHQGIDASAIAGALDACGVKGKRRWQLYRDVLEMGEAAATAMNRRERG